MFCTLLQKRRGGFARFYKSVKRNLGEERKNDNPRIVTTHAPTLGSWTNIGDHTPKGHQLSMMEHGFLRVVSLAAVATLVFRK
jgi:hypothetical protein